MKRSTIVRGSSERPISGDLIVLCCILLIIVAFSATPATAKTIVVSTTIQAAVNAANPGDTVLVPAGTYYESVTVTKSNITIRGNHNAVIDAGGRIGIRVGVGSRTTVDGVRLCPALELSNFTLKGLTIRNARFAAVFLIGVDRYRLTETKYLDDPVYGPFPVCSNNGLIDSNYLVGGNVAGPDVGIDAGIYVGDSDTVTVRNNFVTNYAAGIEIENTSNVIIRDNVVSGNSGGIVILVLPGLNYPFTENVMIERNLVIDNNLPNPVPFDPSPTGEPIGNLPTGTGILNVGGDQVIIRNNTIIGNNSFGVAFGYNPFAALDPRVEPNSDNNQIKNNFAFLNGRHPDPVRAQTPGADIVYDGTGIGSCFRGNLFGTQFPSQITSIFRCQ